MRSKRTPLSAWYYITRRCLNNKVVQEMFRDEWDKLVRDSLFFCLCRAVMLNGLAAARARSPKLLRKTIQTVRRGSALDQPAAHAIFCHPGDCRILFPAQAAGSKGMKG
jgi:hypothetical protein